MKGNQSKEDIELLKVFAESSPEVLKFYEKQKGRERRGAYWVLLIEKLPYFLGFLTVCVLSFNLAGKKTEAIFHVITEWGLTLGIDNYLAYFTAISTGIYCKIRSISLNRREKMLDQKVS